MGNMINDTENCNDTLSQFASSLRQETATLSQWFKSGAFSTTESKIGLEIETWLTSDKGMPVAENLRALELLNHPLIVPELSKYNLEINAPPLDLQGKCFRNLHDYLRQLMDDINHKLQAIDCQLLHIGCLPTLNQQMLDMENISEQPRYRQLNEIVMAQKKANLPLCVLSAKNLSTSRVLT